MLKEGKEGGEGQFLEIFKEGKEGGRRGSF